MAFFAQTGPQGYGGLSASLGQALGSGLGQGIGQSLANRQQFQRQEKESGILGRLLSGEEINPNELRGLPPQLQLQVAQMNAQQQAMLDKQAQQMLAELQKKQKEGQESALLAKYESEGELTPQELSQLSPTSLRTILGQQKPVYEPESEKLEAKRVSELATEIENDYKAFQSEDLRLNKMEKLSEKGQLSSPLMVKTLDTLGLPIGVLGNPDTEEYKKLEVDFLRDARSIFGNRVTNYEAQTFLKSIPSLLNSSEGRKNIIENRKLMNEAKKLRYDAYKDILKEYGGRKPQNMGILIEEKIGPRMEEISEQFKNGISKASEKFQVPIRMIDNQGRIVDIPPDKIQQALEAGAKFR